MQPGTIRTLRFPFITFLRGVVATFPGEIPAVVKHEHRRYLTIRQIIHHHRKIQVIPVNNLNMNQIRLYGIDVTQQCPCRPSGKICLFPGQPGKQSVQFVIRRIPDAVEFRARIMQRRGHVNLVSGGIQKTLDVGNAAAAAAAPVDRVDEQYFQSFTPRCSLKCRRSIAWIA